MKTKLLFFVFALAFNSFKAGAQMRNTFTADDGFTWVSVVGGMGFGAETTLGQVIIPAQFGIVAYIPTDAGGWFYVSSKDNSLHAAYSKTGQCIIPLSRGYKDVSLMDQGWFLVQKNGMYGACDMTGREFISPVHEGLMYDENEGFKTKGSNGLYTALNVWIPGKEPKHEETVTVHNQGGIVPVNGGNSSFNSNNNSSTNHNNTPIRKTCTRCKGSKRVVYERNVNSSFGLEVVMITCSECGKRYDKTSTVHRHEICTSCNGLGYYEFK